MKTLALIALLLASSVALAAPPFKYSRAKTTRSQTTRYYYQGRINGSSFKVGKSTYWRGRSGSVIGRSYTTRSGNTYFRSIKK